MSASEQQMPLYFCVICSEPKEVGVFIGHAFICDDCEKEMVRTEVHEERYRFFVQQLKKVMLKQEA